MKTKAEMIYGKLRERLEKGEFAVGSRFPSEYSLGDEYGVDKKTANKAVSMLEADGLVKRGARGSGTLVVKLRIFPKGHLAFSAKFNYYTAKILNGMQKTALGNGYAVSVFFYDATVSESFQEILACSGVKGIVASGSSSELAIRSGIPLVTVDYDSIVKYPDAHLVNTDNRSGGDSLMREILRRGHRDIAVYSSDRQFPDRQKRINGFLDAMLDSGITDARKRLFSGAREYVPDAVAALRKIRRLYPRATIIACDSDDAAKAMTLAAFELGVRQNEMPVITSYGNTLHSGIPMAGVEQFPEEIGAMACGRLIEFIELGQPKTPVRQLIQPKVVNAGCIPDITRTGHGKA